jgi:hypothetical protein
MSLHTINRGIFVTETLSVSCRHYIFKHLLRLIRVSNGLRAYQPIKKLTPLVCGTTTSMHNSQKFPYNAYKIQPRESKR